MRTVLSGLALCLICLAKPMPDVEVVVPASGGSPPKLAPSPYSRQCGPGLSRQTSGLSGGVRCARSDLQDRCLSLYAVPADHVSRYLTALPTAAAKILRPVPAASPAAPGYERRRTRLDQHIHRYVRERQKRQAGDRHRLSVSPLAILPDPAWPKFPAESGLTRYRSTASMSATSIRMVTVGTSRSRCRARGRRGSIHTCCRQPPARTNLMPIWPAR